MPSSTITPASLDDALRDELAELTEKGLLRALQTAGHRRGAVVQTPRGPRVDFSSNDYLGLASDERLIDAARDAMSAHGAGAAAARLISGNTPAHDALEAELASAFDAPRALAFISGYSANVGIIPAIACRGDAIFADALNHASLIDGARLSRASIHVYPHADAAALEQLLSKHRASAQRALIVTDGLFSMDGDFAPLVELSELARRFDAWTYVDDAHALGALGPGGRGTVGLADVEVDILVGTLGKAFGAAGAFVLGSGVLVEYLVNRARSFVFSTGMMPAQAAAAREGVRIAMAEPERRTRLLENAARLRGRISSILPVASHAVISPIIPVVLGDEDRTMRVAASLDSRGFLVGAVRPPTVPRGGSRLRITATAAHTAEQIDAFTAALECALRE